MHAYALHYQLLTSMAIYVPPHLRRSTAHLMIPERLPNPTQRISQRENRIPNSGMIVYANDSVYKWLSITLDEDGRIPSYVHLQPLIVNVIERRTHEKFLTLAGKNVEQEGLGEAPWACVADKLLNDIKSSITLLKNEAEDRGLKKINPSLNARFGKILFHMRNLNSPTSYEGCDLNEDVLQKWKRTFHTNVTSSFIEKIMKEAVPNISLDCEEKNLFFVRLSDETRPGSTVSCKCRIMNEKNLKLHKVELNQVRHMTADISCFGKDLDFRIMLTTKEVLNDLSGDELDMIKSVLSFGVVDSSVKGGIRWRAGASSGDRYSVIGVSQIRITKFYSSENRLKIRQADRYDYRRDIAEETREVSLKLKKLVQELQGELITDSVKQLQHETFKFIWDHFLVLPAS